MAAKSVVMEDGRLIVQDRVVIPYIEGDGIGEEVMRSARAVFDAAVAAAYPKRSIEWLEVLAGEKAFKATGAWLPEATLTVFKDHVIGIKGPLNTPVGGGIRSLNVALRQELDLFVCLRPVKWYQGVGSPLKHPEFVDMVIFRENTEDIYAGIEWEQGTPEARKFYAFLETELQVSKVRFPDTSSFGVKPVSVEGTERLVRAAIRYALEHKLPSVTLVHKGNIMKCTEGGFKRWGYALAEREFGDQVFTTVQYERIRGEQGIDAARASWENAETQGKLIVKDCIADAFLQNTLLRPRDYSVVATMNLNGDYISDQLAAMVGGIGISPGANINPVTGHAIFEATHGTAPDIAGMNKANPSSLLLSGVMMFDYIGWPAVGERIVAAMAALFKEGQATGDLTAMMPNAQTLSTTAFTNAIIERL